MDIVWVSLWHWSHPGALDFDDGLHLVAERGRLMALAGEQSPGGMAVLLGVSLQDAEALCGAASEASGEALVVANDNCPGQVVISGATAALEAALTLANAYGVRRMRCLPVSVAPHSPLMADVQAAFAQLLDNVPLRKPEIPVVLKRDGVAGGGHGRDSASAVAATHVAGALAREFVVDVGAGRRSFRGDRSQEGIERSGAPDAARR